MRHGGWGRRTSCRRCSCCDTRTWAVLIAAFAGQLAGARSVTDERWCAYWNAIAEEHMAAAADALTELGGPSPFGVAHAARRRRSWHGRRAARSGGARRVDAGRSRTAVVKDCDRADSARTRRRERGDDGAAGRARGRSRRAGQGDHLPAGQRVPWREAVPDARHHRSRRLFDALIDALEPGWGSRSSGSAFPSTGTSSRGTRPFRWGRTAARRC